MEDYINSVAQIASSRSYPKNKIDKKTTDIYDLVFLLNTKIICVQEKKKLVIRYLARQGR